MSPSDDTKTVAGLPGAEAFPGDLRALVERIADGRPLTPSDFADLRHAMEAYAEAYVAALKGSSKVHTGTAKKQAA